MQNPNAHVPDEPLNAEEVGDWTPIGHTADGGGVFAAPVGTPPSHLGRLRVVRTPPNPHLPADPIPEPPRRSILRDAIEAVATITRRGR